MIVRNWDILIGSDIEVMGGVCGGGSGIRIGYKSRIVRIAFRAAFTPEGWVFGSTGGGCSRLLQSWYSMHM